MKVKSLAIQTKAGPDDGLAEGEFEAYASVFGNVDSYGDVVMPGAFDETLADWKASGNVLPLLWGHNMADPDYNLGAVVDAVSDDHGLRVKSALDLDSPKAAQVYRLLKSRRVSQMSFAYEVLDGGAAERDGEPVFELKRLRLHEISVVPVGANQQTEVLGVKTAAEAVRAGSLAGRVLSKENVLALQGARDAIDAVLAVSVDSKAGGGASHVGDGPSGASPRPVGRLHRELALLAMMNNQEG